MMRFLLLVGHMLLSFPLLSQEQMGLRLENYAGASSLSLNPAGNLVNPLSWDINLVGLGFFFENNYFYIQQAGTVGLLTRSSGETVKLAKNVEGPVSANTYLLDFYDDGHRRYAAFGSYMDGPSVVVKFGERHSAGIFTRARAVMASHGLPNDFSYYRYDNRPFFDPFQVPRFQGAMMTWAEIGLNYALKIPNSHGFLGLGANLRYLMGYEAAFVENLDAWEHTKLPGNAISVGHPNGRFGFTNSNLDGEGFTPSRNGSGFGIDLGAVQTFGDGGEFYKFRLGASLLDLGYLRFSRQTEAHRVNTDATPVLTLDDYKQFNAVERFDDLVHFFSGQTLGDSLASRSGDEFTLMLPSAFSLQADYSIAGSFYANATWMQRIPLGGVTAARGNLLAVTPRFEHRWLSVSMPVSLYNWQRLNIGFAARLGFLVVGTDNLGSIVGKGEYTGTDFYIALKINPFSTHLDKFGGGGHRRYGGKGKVRCYDF